MRAPSLLAQCLTGFTPPERGRQTTATISERSSSIPLPAFEVLPSKGIHPFKYGGENADLQGIGMRKGRLSFADVIGFGSSDIICSKLVGCLKSWDSSIDLVNVLKQEIRDGQLSFRGKRVLEEIGILADKGEGEGGYDVVLMADLSYSLTLLKKLYPLSKKEFDGRRGHFRSSPA